MQMLHVRTHATMLRRTAAKAISGPPVMSPAKETEMRNLETLTSGLFAVATIVLAVEAIIAL